MTSPKLASSSELLPGKKDGAWIKNVLEGDGLENSNFAVQRELHSQAVYTDLFYHSQTNQNNAMFGLFVVLGGGYSTRQGSEDLSEAALSVTDAAKLGISWRDLTAFCLEVLHFNILFFLRHLSFNYLNNLLVYNSENLYNFFRLWFQFWLPPLWKKVTRKYFNVAFWGKAK